MNESFKIQNDAPPELESAPNMMKTALDYAERGWKVFPVHSPVAGGQCSCGDKQCGKIAKHPRIRQWNTAATTDARQITEWWTKWPNANIGILTGPTSGIWVLDVDDRKNGR